MKVTKQTKEELMQSILLMDTIPQQWNAEGKQRINMAGK